MKIVAIDGYALNPGDLDWNVFAEFGTIQVYDRTRPEHVIERCKDADVILTNKIAFKEEHLKQLPKLKLIAVTATGYDIIDLAAAKSRGVAVCNVPGYGTDSVAQHTFAFILVFANKISLHAKSVSNGDWSRSPDFAYTLGSLSELKGKVLGLVGLGNIGLQTAVIAKAFGMEVIYSSRSDKKTELGKQVSVEEVFEQADVVSLHVPLLADNVGFVNSKYLAKMKPTALLINTARGKLINEQDLADALNNGTIAGAGLDVLAQEPPALDNPLLKAKNCLITPHNAWMSREARQRIVNIAADNIRSFLKGEDLNRVNS